MRSAANRVRLSSRERAGRTGASVSHPRYTVDIEGRFSRSCFNFLSHHIPAGHGTPSPIKEDSPGRPGKKRRGTQRPMRSARGSSIPGRIGRPKCDRACFQSVTRSWNPCGTPGSGVVGNSPTRHLHARYRDRGAATLSLLLSRLNLPVTLRNEGEGGPDHANKGAHPPRVSVVVGGCSCQAGAEQGSRGVCLSLSAGNAGSSTRPDRSPSVPPSLLFTCKGHRVGGRGRRGPDQPPELVGNTAPVPAGQVRQDLQFSPVDVRIPDRDNVDGSRWSLFDQPPEHQVSVVGNGRHARGFLVAAQGAGESGQPGTGGTSMLPLVVGRWVAGRGHVAGDLVPGRFEPPPGRLPPDRSPKHRRQSRRWAWLSAPSSGLPHRALSFPHGPGNIAWPHWRRKALPSASTLVSMAVHPYASEAPSRARGFEISALRRIRRYWGVQTCFVYIFRSLARGIGGFRHRSGRFRRPPGVVSAPLCPVLGHASGTFGARKSCYARVVTGPRRRISTAGCRIEVSAHGPRKVDGGRLLGYERHHRVPRHPRSISGTSPPVC